MSYLSETAGNVTGGSKRSSVYADQRLVQLDVDGGKLAGLTGFGVHLLFVNRAGHLLAGALGNDQYNPNEVYGSAGDVAVHLAYAYVDQTFADGALKLSVGRMSPAMFFNSSDIYCNFLNFATCPTPHAVMGGDFAAFSIWPANKWGGVLRANAPSSVLFQAGVFETTPLSGGLSGFDWSSSQDTGVTVLVEIGWEPHLGRDALPAHLKAGLYYDTSSQPDVLYDVNGGLIPLTGLPAKRPGSYRRLGRGGHDAGAASDRPWCGPGRIHKLHPQRPKHLAIRAPVYFRARGQGTARGAAGRQFWCPDRLGASEP